MRYLIYICILTVSAMLLSSCYTQNSLSDTEAKDRAVKIALSFDSTTIEIFRTWSHIPRGRVGIWYRNAGDSSLYKCVYLPQTDSLELLVLGHEEFLKDFNSEFPLDTSLWRVIFTKGKNGKLRITGTNNHGKDVLIASNVSQDSIFPLDDPFDKFKELNNLKDSLGFFGVRHYKGLGGLIEFQLSAEHVLNYVPDVNLIEQPFLKVWESNFSKGEWIKKDWNLRKLDKPIDNG